MIRILYWNIQDFARNKIDNPNTRHRQQRSSLDCLSASESRCEYILSHVRATAPNLFVVVEVETRFDGRGRLVDPNGFVGSKIVLAALRDLNDDWMLVPPLQTGPNEGVSVYYRASSLVFTGPYAFTGGDSGVSNAREFRDSGYPEDIAAYPFLPDRLIPHEAQYNPGMRENVRAACVDFSTGGDPIDFEGSRAPYEVTFAEVHGDPLDVRRNLTLFAVHAPADRRFALPYMRDLTTVDQITAANAPNELRVLVGDFNVDRLTDGNDPEQAYADFHTATGYTPALSPLAPPPDPSGGYAGYFATHIRTCDTAEYWHTDDRGNTNAYPGYGYVGTQGVRQTSSIDNCFVRYSTSADSYPPGHDPTNPPPNTLTVLNGVVGSPYNRWPAPAGALPGTFAFPISMRNPWFANPPQHAPDFSIDLWHAINRSWWDYGRIRSTSDHMALVIDV